jgi:polyisoprenoid-binding protein YceI
MCRAADEQWKVDGTLTLHGVTKPITVAVKRNGDAYIGHATLRQTDFGITPISAAAGTVKVKNELEIDFHIVTATP